MNRTSSPAGPESLYRRRLQQGEIAPDAAQAEAVDRLERRFRELIRRWQSPSGLLRSWFSRVLPAGDSDDVTGLYLWGGVGRGKTFLMDLFFHSLPGERKLRMHFHRFMLMVHERMRREQGRSDPLVHVARGIAGEVDVICFDEFFVSDIGDAMILANLLETLFAEGVMLVATSNIEPARLYERGLQRQKFLPAIALLQRHCEVLNVDGGIDYRLRSLDKAPVYHFPLGPDSEAALERLFADLSRGLHVEADPELEIAGRRFRGRRRTEDLVWFDFAALCRGPRGAADYIELARQYQTVFVSGVPCFDEARDDEARRFITMVDEFYDHGVKLVLSAEAPLEALYRGTHLRFPFERTRSRLLEMQSRDYLAAAHHPD